jgi:hypothetical protein
VDPPASGPFLTRFHVRARGSPVRENELTEGPRHRPALLVDAPFLKAPVRWPDLVIMVRPSLRDPFAGTLCDSVPRPLTPRQRTSDDAQPLSFCLVEERVECRGGEVTGDRPHS